MAGGWQHYSNISKLLLKYLLLLFCLFIVCSFLNLLIETVLYRGFFKKDKLFSIIKVLFLFQNLIMNSKAVNLAEALEYSGSTSVPATSPVVGCAEHVPCLNSTCKHGGQCLDMWTHQLCSCVLGFTGPTCALQNMANFHKESMLYFDERGVISQLSLEFNAVNESGLLLYTVPYILIILPKLKVWTLFKILDILLWI